MKYSAVLAVAGAGLVAANQVDVATVLLSDVKDNLNEYIALVGGTIPIPTVLVDLYTQVATYTDDSYTTLLTDFPVAEVESIVTELPWYSSRLESKLSVAATEGLDATVVSSSAEPTEPTTSSEVPITSVPSLTSSVVETSETSESSYLADIVSSSEAPVETPVETPLIANDTNSTTSTTASVTSYEDGAIANLQNIGLPLVLLLPVVSLLL